MTQPSRLETIPFEVGTCTLGAILVASSRNGVCAILLGDDTEELAVELRRRFPRDECVEVNGDAKGVVARVISFVEDSSREFGLPLDLRGTDFQRRVWNVLATVPAGTTTTYAEVAGRIGAPGSARAVAGACAANPVAVAIPCHRVVRGDGSLSGYRWGVGRKAALLARESALFAGAR